MQENTKQVIVKMTARRAFRTEPIYQYDVGHELVFEGFELPATFEVHFSLSPMGKSITQVGQNGVCVLPDMYAQTAAPIYAWLYIADTDTGLTKYSIEIPVQKRAKPTDQQPTPVQQSAIDQAIAALNAGVEAAEDAQEAAEAAQASAESYAESAGQSAITATNAATSAGTSATSAAGSATAAASSAADANASRQAADLSATNAGISERNAAASATAAAGSATSAAASASQASGSATAASGSASTASTKAGEAAQSATAAAGSAASASENAGTASTAATAAEASATAAAGSATAAAGSATSAGQSATAAAGSASNAAEIKDYLDENYGEISEDVNSLKSALNVLQPAATTADVGKAMKVKTVANGKVSEYEFGEAAVIDSTLSNTGEAADAKATGDAIAETDAIATQIRGYSNKPDLVWKNGYLINTYGQYVENASFNSTDYIEIPDEATTISITLSANAYTGYLYDGQYKGIKKVNLVSGNNIIPVIGYSYFAVCVLNTVSATDIHFSLARMAKSGEKNNTYAIDKLDYVYNGGSSSYSIISNCDEEIRSKFYCRKCTTVNNRYTTLQNTYEIYKANVFSEAIVINKKYQHVRIFIRSIYGFTVAVNDLAYTSAGGFKPIYDVIKINVSDSDLLNDTKMIDITYIMKDSDIGTNCRLYPKVDATFSNVPDYETFVANYNGFEAFYFRWFESDNFLDTFDNSLSIVTNRAILTGYGTTEIYKKICLYGTSIEAGNYLDYACERLGLIKNVSYFNYACGGGGIVWSPSEMIDLSVEKGFSCTMEEKLAELENRGIDPSTVLSGDLNTCYDVSLLPNTDCDLFIIGTYGINDRIYQNAYSTDLEFDRSSIYGAYNYVLRALYTAKPNAKVIILGQHTFQVPGLDRVNAIQKLVAERWCIPFLNWGYELGINDATASTYLGDGMHFNATGAQMAGKYMLGKLKQYIV